MKLYYLLPLLLLTSCSLADVAEETDTSMKSFGETMDVHKVSIDEATGVVTREQFALHHEEDDCWILYQEEVYDVTTYLEEHPGGIEAISMHCGKETFRAALTNEHGASKDGKLIKEARYIGTLTD